MGEKKRDYNFFLESYSSQRNHITDLAKYFLHQDFISQ